MSVELECADMVETIKRGRASKVDISVRRYNMEACEGLAKADESTRQIRFLQKNEID